MSSTLFPPVEYGDTDSTLARHQRALGQSLTTPTGATAYSIIGDAGALLGFAAGGDDSIVSSASGAANALGDAQTLSGHAVGGADFVSASAGFEAYAAGDGFRLEDHAIGGDDTVSAQGAFAAEAYGDGLLLTDHAHGGADLLSGRSPRGWAQLFGDAVDLTGHAGGGDDTITGQRGYPIIAYGDAQGLSGFARGGDDLLLAGSNVVAGAPHTGPNKMYGDGLTLSDHSVGGDDTLVGGQGSYDQMWGDAATIGPGARTGADLFVVQPGGGRDEIMDFEPGKDHLSFNGFGFASADEVAALSHSTPEGLVIDLAGGELFLKGLYSFPTSDLLLG